MTEESVEEEFPDVYNYCPQYGKEWTAETYENHQCDELTLAEYDKPKFNVMYLWCYNEEFIRRIAQWQDNKIKILEKKLKEVQNANIT